jgi:hypothetical protein
MNPNAAWSEAIIAAAIAEQTLAKKCVVLVDNCNWTGNECDVLGVTEDLRVIDVEIKISRADLRADAKKEKWWHSRMWDGDGYPARQPREWPHKVWKHYYALPADLWRDDLLAALPSPKSGVLLLRRDADGRICVSCHRRATPCRDATRLTPENVMAIARLANLRMWDAYREADRYKVDAAYLRGIWAA